MDALEYLKAKSRMFCDRHCPITRYEIGEYETHKHNTAVEFVEQWALNNPIATYKSEFLKLFPNASVYDNGYPQTSLWLLTGNVVVQEIKEGWDAEFKGWS